MLELAISGRHRNHSLWLLTQSYSCNTKKFKTTEKDAVLYGIQMIVAIYKKLMKKRI